MRVGFTGTQEGMTEAQKNALSLLIANLDPSEFHHGDCIGADKEAREIFGYKGSIAHPPVNPLKRAFTTNELTYPVQDYRARNAAIVRRADLLIACPKGQEEEVRSGTWMTVRMARKSGKPLIIIWPDGRVEGPAAYLN